ncbi:MAG: hypothetical protein LQ349_005971, partial [Xanthoria aureola]
VSSIQMTAEMQAPTQTVLLELAAADEEKDHSDFHAGESLQRIVRFDLQSEGNHVLAVSVTYTETDSDGEDQSKSRTRTFRKLYQFIAAPCLSVRTKVSGLPVQGNRNEKRSQTKPVSFALEVQLENMADGPITLERVAFSPKQSFNTTSINWDVSWPDTEKTPCPFLMPRDVTQVAFLIKQQPDAKQSKSQVETTKDGRIILGKVAEAEWYSSFHSSTGILRIIMASSSRTIRTCQGLGITSSSFLAGALYSISLLAIPAILVGKSNASLLASQWHSIFSVGQKVGPTLAILGTVNYLYVARGKYGSQYDSRVWKSFVGAAVATMGIIPFTFIFLKPTNDVLLAQTAKTTLSEREVRALVEKWASLNLVRSGLLVIGTGLGLYGAL